MEGSQRSFVELEGKLHIDKSVALHFVDIAGLFDGACIGVITENTIV
jgi:hypothetical protein